MSPLSDLPPSFAVPSGLSQAVCSDLTLSLLRTRKQKKVAQGASTAMPMLSLLGPTGTGKTTDAVGLMRQQIEKGFIGPQACGYVFAPDLSGLDPEELGMLYSLPFLIVDEVAMIDTQGARDRLAKVFKHRDTKRGLRTIITGNINKSTKLDERVRDLIRASVQIDYSQRPSFRPARGEVLR